MAEVWGDSTSWSAMIGVMVVLTAFIAVAGLAVLRYVQAGSIGAVEGAMQEPGRRAARRGLARMVEAQNQG